MSHVCTYDCPCGRTVKGGEQVTCPDCGRLLSIDWSRDADFVPAPKWAQEMATAVKGAARQER